MLNSPTSDQPTRRGRAVWGPVLNTNFAIMDETEAHLSQAAIISPSNASIKSSNELDLKFKTEEGSDLIPFPSPSLDNDFFPVKQLDKRLMSNDEDDMLEYKEETFEIEHEVRIVSEPEPKSPVILDTDSPRQRSTSLKLEVNDECSENGSLKNSMLSPFNRSIDSRDGLLKFDSDMDNSFKRQSISARYLMKTQLQKQQSEQKSPPIKVEPVKASLELSSSIDVIAPVKINSTATSAQFGLNSTAQIAADMLKIRRKSSVLNAIPHSSTSPSISSLGSSSNLTTQQLYNHHTESSLNKTKTKSTSNEASSSSSSKSNHLSVVSASGMKRSPSVNSLNESSNKPKTEPKTKTTPVKQQNLTKNHSLNVPGKNNANGNNSTDSDESSNLKKAVSMLSLYSKNQTSTNQRQSSSSGSPKHTNSTPNSSSSSITAGSTLLPPKTVRQIKQRSAERQLTSSIITISSKASTPTTQTNPIETFTEQSKHLRKLSNSVQNLAQASNLPPQPPPRSPSKSPQLDTSKNEPICKSKKSSTQELKAKRVAETITSAKMSELLIIDQIKRLDSDQMSSSSSHNGDYIESNQLDNDDNPNHQSNQFQTSSNSLTSSSSSSCSLFENMNQGSSINNDIHLETSSNLNQTLTKLDELGNSNENKLNKNELKLNLNKSADLSRPTELDFNSPTSNSHLYNSGNSSVNSNNISSMMSSNYNGLKKPITFAAIAAANSPNAINVCSLTSSTNAKNGNQLTNDKIESILNEFKQNIYLLDLIYNQVNEICFVFFKL